MIGRIRGEHGARWGRWRHTKARETADAPAWQTGRLICSPARSFAEPRVAWRSVAAQASSKVTRRFPLLVFRSAP